MHAADVVGRIRKLRSFRQQRMVQHNFCQLAESGLVRFGGQPLDERMADVDLEYWLRFRQ